MAHAAERAEVTRWEVSLVGGLLVIKSRRDEYPGCDSPKLETWIGSFLRELGQERLPPRRQRANPRVVKRKMSKFKKKRPEHKGIKPLERPFAATIVIQPVAQPAGRT